MTRERADKPVEPPFENNTLADWARIIAAMGVQDEPEDEHAESE